ncbi:cytochrome c [Vibrio sp. 03-59-1]|uniref:c-type cytochrome n=1 Tax=Vibrio TaxID=662 RepID=UPI001493C2E5|nr:MULTISPECIES: cytochrome c [Vibrio]MDN3696676.1 cytochrome c [Vibrio cortegadensis]NOH85613.1 cytochrome c [Vibrio sp. 03-59-1]
MLKITAILLIATISTGAYADNINISAGESTYKTLCVSCHGELGHGDGLAGKALSEQPSNIYEGLNSWFEPEYELIDTVLNGNEGMPAWRSVLEEKDVKNIFAYIQKING